MTSPYLGMNPYLEQPTFWSSFHARLIVVIANTIAPALRPHYYTEVETRSYTDEPEGEAITSTSNAVALNRIETGLSRKERYLEIRSIRDDSVITVIEVLSRANKRKGNGHNQYEQRPSDLLGSNSNLVEIDLLRGQSRLTVDSSHNFADYYILVSIADQRP